MLSIFKGNDDTSQVILNKERVWNKRYYNHMKASETQAFLGAALSFLITEMFFRVIKLGTKIHVGP